MRDAKVCDYCEFIGSADAVRYHEAGCVYNPSRRGCFTCKKYINKPNLSIWLCPSTSKFISDPIAATTVLCKEWEENIVF